MLLSQKKVVTLVNTGLVLTLAYTAAQLTWRLLPDDGDGVATIMVQGTIPTGSTAGPGDKSTDIASLHLFGQINKSIPVQHQAPADVPDTHLKLTLRGVAATGNKLTALAIIADSSDSENYYRIDDPIPGNAILREIYPDRVILQRAGRLETLRLPKDAPSTTTVKSNSITGTTGHSSGQSQALAKQLSRYRERIMKNPVAATRLVSVQPVEEGGKLKGYRVNPKRDRHLYKQAGLQQDDVVTSVNGIPLDDPAKVGEVISQLSNASRLDLQVERDGIMQSIVVDIGD